MKWYIGKNYSYYQLYKMRKNTPIFLDSGPYQGTQNYEIFASNEIFKFHSTMPNCVANIVDNIQTIYINTIGPFLSKEDAEFYLANQALW